MPVVYDNSARVVTTSTSATITLTITSGACLLVGVATKPTVGKSVSAVYCNGVAMTQLARIEAPSTTPVINTIFGLTAAPSGVVSINANLVGASTGLGLFGITYTNAKDVSPFKVNVKATTSTATNNISVCSSANDVAVFFCTGTNVITSGATNATMRQQDTSSFGFYVGDTAATNGGTSFSTSTSVSAGYSVAMIAISVAFSAAATTSFHQWRALMDVGF